MAWTTVLDSDLITDKPIKYTDIRAIRDNITALANGDSGAPRNEEESISTGGVTAGDYHIASLGVGPVSSDASSRDYIASFSGTIRVRLMVSKGTGSGSCRAHLRVNGTSVFSTGSIGSTLSTEATGSVSISQGDTVDVLFDELNSGVSSGYAAAHIGISQKSAVARGFLIVADIESLVVTDFSFR